MKKSEAIAALAELTDEAIAETNNGNPNIALAAGKRLATLNVLSALVNGFEPEAETPPNNE